MGGVDEGESDLLGSCATFVAVHVSSGCVAALMVEPGFVGMPLDDYVTLVFESRKAGAPGMKDLARTDVDFGGNEGRRLETSWKASGETFRGFTTVCQAGQSYYLLSGWCTDDVYSNALSQFQLLEKGSQITGSQPEANSIVVNATPKSGGSGKQRK